MKSVLVANQKNIEEGNIPMPTDYILLYHSIFIPKSLTAGLETSLNREGSCCLAEKSVEILKSQF